MHWETIDNGKWKTQTYSSAIDTRVATGFCTFGLKKYVKLKSAMPDFPVLFSLAL